MKNCGKYEIGKHKEDSENLKDVNKNKRGNIVGKTNLSIRKYNEINNITITSILRNSGILGFKGVE